MSTAIGTYFDGETARSHPVTFAFGENGSLHVQGENFTFTVEASDFSVSDRLGDVPRFIYLPGHKVIETSENAAVDAATESRPSTAVARLIHLLESRQWIAVVGCAVLVMATALLGYYGPPALARSVARRVPPEIDARIGHTALAAIRPYFHESTLTPAEREAVQKQLDRLQAGTKAPAVRLEFLSMNGNLPNAFALPGNVIVVTDEIVRLPLNDDEMAAVLAHELGHLEQRHGLQTILRDSITVLVVAAVTGDSTALTSFAATIPMTILTAGYARDFEREADRHARDLLRARGIPARAFASTLVKLEDKYKALPKSATYLSTHPDTEERVALFGGIAPAERKTILAQPWLEQGKRALTHGQFDRAITDFTAAIAANPSADTYALEARAAVEKQDFASADALLRKATELDPRNVSVQIVKAQIYAYHDGKFDDAIAAAKEALRADPKNGLAAAMLGYAETSQKKFDAAAEDLDHAVAWAPDEPRSWAARAHLRMARRQYAEALTDLDRAVALAPELEWLRRNRGVAHVLNQQPKEALADLSPIKDRHLRDGVFLYYLALAKQQNGDVGGAIETYTRSLERLPPLETRLSLFTNRAFAYAHQHDSERALADFDSVLVLDPKSGAAYMGRASVKRQRGDFEGALTDIRLARQYLPDARSIAETEAQLLWDAGRYAEARATLTQILEKEPTASDLRRRGIIEITLRQLEEAETDLTASLAAQKSGDPGARYNEIYRVLARRLRHVDDGEKEFAAAVERWPDGWTKMVGRYVARRATEAQLMEKVVSGGDPGLIERRCEAYYYIGMNALLEDDADLAEFYLHQCVETGVRNYFEYALAKGELARLQGTPHK